MKGVEYICGAGPGPTGATMVKLIVQIPCFDEERTLPLTLAAIPRRIEGVDRIEILVIDDGSRDRTAEVARSLGVEHVVRHPVNRGLAQAFQTGLDTALRLGADVVVNTDADNQYPGEAIPDLIRPILEGRADLVVGDRQTRSLAHFSFTKRWLQRFGSFVVRRLSGVDVPDAVSGFRAMSRKAALQTTILSSFSYTTEQLIQAGHKNLTVVSVPAGANPGTRPSRLFRSVPRFVASTAATMIRTYTMFRPIALYSTAGSVLVAVGLTPVLRFLYFYFSGEGGGHVQSLVLGGVFLVLGFVTFLIGVVADLVSVNRRLLELTIEKVRQLETDRRAPAPPRSDDEPRVPPPEPARAGLSETPAGSTD
jgi:glycosyltransferase involved in cell wall biosynthesis